MSALLILCALLLARTGGSGPPVSGFGFAFGTGRIVGILVAVLVGGVLVALIRAGGSRK